MYRSPATVRTIDLDRDQMIVLSAGEDAPLSALYGALWLGRQTGRDQRHASSPAAVTTAAAQWPDAGDDSPPSGSDHGARRSPALRPLRSLRSALRAWQRGLQRFVRRQQFGPVATVEF